jgi:hypothetical protein
VPPLVLVLPLPLLVPLLVPVPDYLRVLDLPCYIKGCYF